MNLGLSTARRRSLISLTPLIDVVFILLLFFMLASNFSQERSVSISSVAQRTEQPGEQLIDASRVFLQATGRYVLDGITMPPLSLLEELRSRQILNPAHSVVVSVGEDINVQTLLGFIASIKQTGVVKVVMDASAYP